VLPAFHLLNRTPVRPASMLCGKQLALPPHLRLGRRPLHSILVPGSTSIYKKLALTQQCLAVSPDMSEQQITWTETASEPSLQDSSSEA